MGPPRYGRWFINHKITPSNYSYIMLYLPFLATLIRQLNAILAAPILCPTLPMPSHVDPYRPWCALQCLRFRFRARDERQVKMTCQNIWMIPFLSWMIIDYRGCSWKKITMHELGSLVGSSKMDAFEPHITNLRFP